MVPSYLQSTLIPLQSYANISSTRTVAGLGAIRCRYRPAACSFVHTGRGSPSRPTTELARSGFPFSLGLIGTEIPLRGISTCATRGISRQISKHAERRRSQRLKTGSGEHYFIKCHPCQHDTPTFGRNLSW